MRPPRSLEIIDLRLGTGRKVVPGDVAVCRCRCTRMKGDIVFSSENDQPYSIRVGARNYCVGIEYGLIGMQIGGLRSVKVPPNLIYIERKSFPDIPENSGLVYELELIDLPQKWNPEMESRIYTKTM